MGYFLAHGNSNCKDMDTPNFNFGNWTRLNHVDPGYILGFDVTGNNGLSDLRGSSSHKHGRGVNVVLFDGSAAFQSDPLNRLEVGFSISSVGDGRPNRRNSKSDCAAAWLYINSYGRSQAWVDNLFK
jgi:prepilin-type processing-associated H-X9-DG protein